MAKKTTEITKEPEDLGKFTKENLKQTQSGSHTTCPICGDMDAKAEEDKTYSEGIDNWNGRTLKTTCIKCNYNYSRTEEWEKIGSTGDNKKEQ